MVDSSTAGEGCCIAQYGKGVVVNMWLGRRDSEVTLLKKDNTLKSKLINISGIFTRKYQLCTQVSGNVPRL